MDIRAIQRFYHLDRWADHSFSEGFQEAMEGLTGQVHDALKNSRPIGQSLAGTSLAVGNLAMGIPIGFLQWGGALLKESDKGVRAMLFKAVEVPLQGMIDSAWYVYERVGQWKEGYFYNKDSFTIANEVVTTLGIAALVFFSGKTIIKGIHQFRQFRFAFKKPPLWLLPNGTAAFSRQFALSTAVQAYPSFIKSAIYLSAAQGTRGTSDGSDKALVACLKKHRGGKNLAAKELGVAVRQVRARTKAASEGTDLAVFDRSRRDRALADALKNSGGDIDKAIESLPFDFNRSALKKRIQRARRENPLAEYRRTIPIESDIRSIVPNAKIAEALDRHKGNVSKAARDPNIKLSKTALYERLDSANRNSSLFRYTNEAIAEALTATKDNIHQAATRLRIDPRLITDRIRRARWNNVLAPFKHLVVARRGPKSVRRNRAIPKTREITRPSLRTVEKSVTDDEIYQALLTKDGRVSINLAITRLKMTMEEILNRIRTATAQSKLAKLSPDKR